jgi:hypothetical protein
MRRYLLAMLAILCVPVYGLAQIGTGLPPFGSIERMNLDLRNNQNLNVVLAIPIVASPGRGLNLDFSVVYNSLSWAPGGGVWNPAFNSNPNALWGWQLTFKPNQTTYVATTTQGTCGHIAGDTGQTYTTQYRNFQYVDPYGTAHGFPVWWKDVYSTCTDTDTITGLFTGSSGDGYSISISSADGSIISVLSRGGGNVTNPGMTIDRNGNYISSSSPQSGETDWTDTLGRVALKVISGSSSIQYKFPDTNGAYQTSTVNLQNLSVKTSFGCPGVAEYNGTVSLPVSLVLADGETYQFAYEPTPGYSGYFTGRVQRVTLPAGGYYEYDYTGPNDGINCADGTTLNMNRVVSDGTTTATWKFSRNTSNLTATITTPPLPIRLSHSTASARKRPVKFTKNRLESTPSAR